MSVDPIRTARSAGYAFDDAFGKSWADGVYRLVRRYSGDLGF